MSAILVAICLGLTFIASRTTYWIFKVFVGFMWWALAFYWVQLPASTNSALQTILIMLPIGIGIACAFWAFWTSSHDEKTGQEINGRFKLPFIKGDEENSEPSLTRKERNIQYSKRLNSALRGNRR